MAQLVDGSRSTLIVAFLAASIATVVSIIVGLAGGYLGGVSDELLSVLSNVFLVIPTLPLVIVLAGYLPNRGDLSVTLVIALTGWAWGARVMRAQTLSIRKRDYIEAARATGEGTWRILLWEILPNELAIVTASFLVHRHLCNTHRRRLGLSRPGERLGVVLGDDAVLGAERLGVAGGCLVVVRPTWSVHRAGGLRTRLVEFRL